MRSSIASLLSLLLASPAAWTQTPDSVPISLDAESSILDRASNTMSFKKLHIQQGSLSIEADDASASGLDFDHSEWTFRGRVRVNLDTAILNADRAEFLFEDHALASARLSGAPATLEARDEARDAQISGGAQEVLYSRADGTLRLSGAAWLTEGQNEMRGCDLIYDMVAQRVTVGTSDCGEPIRITILPPPPQSANPSPP
jgi:lipopolysaccharide transport protein LptA